MLASFQENEEGPKLGNHYDKSFSVFFFLQYYYFFFINYIFFILQHYLFFSYLIIFFILQYYIFFFQYYLYFSILHYYFFLFSLHISLSPRQPHALHLLVAGGRVPPPRGRPPPEGGEPHPEGMFLPYQLFLASQASRYVRFKNFVLV